MHCLVAHGEGGMRIDEGANQSQGSDIELQLQKSFTDLVVNELKSVSIRQHSLGAHMKAISYKLNGSKDC